MSDDEAAFLRAILAEPESDAPRLVFADWLDEHGQPERAEYIRLACNGANAGRQWALYNHAAMRLGELPSHPDAWRWQVELRDLTPTLVVDDAATFARAPKASAALAAAWTLAIGYTPDLSRVTARQLFGRPDLGSVRRLFLFAGSRRHPLLWPPALTREFCEPIAPHLRQLDSLDFPNCRITDASLVGLLERADTSRLVALRWVCGSQLTDTGAEWLAGRDFPALCWFELIGSEFTAVGRAALARAAWWPNVHSLDTSPRGLAEYGDTRPSWLSRVWQWVRGTRVYRESRYRP